MSDAANTPNITDPTPEDIESLVSRFGKARWIHGAAVTTVADNPFSIVWTRKGQQQMARLHRMMKSLRTYPRQGLLAKIAVRWWLLKFVFFSAEVQWPLLSIRERWALVGIAEMIELGSDGLPTQEYKMHLGTPGNAS